MHAVQNFDGGRFLTIGLIWHANSSWGKTFNWKNFDKLHTSCQICLIKCTRYVVLQNFIHKPNKFTISLNFRLQNIIAT